MLRVQQTKIKLIGQELLEIAEAGGGWFPSSEAVGVEIASLKCREGRNDEPPLHSQVLAEIVGVGGGGFASGGAARGGEAESFRG